MRLSLMCAAALLASGAPAATELARERVIQASPGKEIRRIAVSPDGKWIASASGDGLLRVQDLPGGLAGWSSPIPPIGLIEYAGLLFSTDGKLLGFSNLNELRVYDAATGRLRHTFAAADRRPQLCADGKRYRTAAGGVEIFDVATGKLLSSLDGKTADMVSPDCSLYWKNVFKGNCHQLPDGLTACDNEWAGGEVAPQRELWRKPATPRVLFGGYSEDGASVYMIDGTILDARTGEVQMTVPFDRAWSDKTVFSKSLIAALTTDGKVTLLRRSDASRLGELESSYVSSSAAKAFSADERTVYQGDDSGNLLSFNVGDGKFAGAVGAAGYDYGGAVSPDGKYAVGITDRSGAILYDLASGKPIRKLLGPPAPEAGYPGISFTPDGTRLLLADRSAIKSYDVPAFTEGQQLQHERTSKIVFSRDGSRALTLQGSFGEPMLWNMETFALIKKLNVFANPSLAALSPDAKYAAIANEKTIDVWNLQTGAMARNLEEFTGTLLDLAASPDGALVAAFVDTGAVTVWDFKTAELRGTAPAVIEVPGSGAIAFTPDGKRLAVAGRRGVAVLDAASLAVLATGKVDAFHACIGFGPGARTVAACHAHGLAVFRLEPEPAAKADTPSSAVPARSTRRKH